MSLAPRTGTAPTWLSDLMAMKSTRGAAMVDGSVEGVIRILDEFFSMFGWRRIVAARSSSAVIVFRRPGQILRFRAAPVIDGRRARTSVDVEWVRLGGDETAESAPAARRTRH